MIYQNNQKSDTHLIHAWLPSLINSESWAEYDRLSRIPLLFQAYRVFNLCGNPAVHMQINGNHLKH